MDYRIENKEAFQVFGYEGIFNTDGIGVNADILHDNAVHPNNPHEPVSYTHLDVYQRQIQALSPLTYGIPDASAPAYGQPHFSEIPRQRQIPVLHGGVSPDAAPFPG